MFKYSISSFSPDHNPTSRSYEYAHFIDKETQAPEDEVACPSHGDGIQLSLDWYANPERLRWAVPEVGRGPPRTPNGQTL